MTARRWLEPSFLIAALGLAVSIYLSVEHFTSSTTLACPETGMVNCAKVTTSSYAAILGIPVALLGLLYFVAMVILVSPPGWQRPALDPVRIGAAILGVIMVLYLVYVELFKVSSICLWCTVVHLCTLALLGVILWRTAGRERA